MAHTIWIILILWNRFLYLLELYLGDIGLEIVRYFIKNGGAIDQFSVVISSLYFVVCQFEYDWLNISDFMERIPSSPVVKIISCHKRENVVCNPPLCSRCMKNSDKIIALRKQIFQTLES